MPRNLLRLLQRRLVREASASWALILWGLLAWCREGESNPQDPKVGGF